MTSPTGSEHLSRYRALGEFDNLIRAARDAKKALRELREEEAKLNAQSLTDDRKLAASKQARARVESDANASVMRAMSQLSRNRQAAAKAGDDNAKEFTHRFGMRVESEAKAMSRTTLERATRSMHKHFSDEGSKSGKEYTHQFGMRAETEFRAMSRTTLERISRTMNKMFSDSGKKSGEEFVTSLDRTLSRVNQRLTGLNLDEISLDVGSDDAVQQIQAIEFELKQLAHQGSDVKIRFKANEALVDVRRLSRLLKDELGQDLIKEAERVRKELEKIDKLPSGKAFKFWALTALADMSRVFSEAERGTSVFTRLRLAAAAGGSGGGFLRSFISGFDDFSESSSRFLQRLSRVSGELYRMPGVIAVLVAALPALISGLGALGGGALGLASALGAAGGAIAAFPGLISAMVGAAGGLALTFGGLSDVLKTARNAQEEQAEAQEKARLGTDKALTAVQKHNLAMRELGPATRTGTNAIVEFSNKWTDVKNAVAENFFKEVVDQTGRLNQLLPIANDYFGRSATAMGKVADEGIRMITSGPWKRDFQTISKNNAVVIENMGKAGLSLMNVFRNVAIAAGPFTEWLSRAFRDGAKAFADWSAQARSNGAISSFLDETKESLQILWQIFKNLGNVVNSFFQSTVDEGQRYLRTLEDITGHWADVAEAQEAANSPLREWLVQIRPILSALGALVRDLARGIGNLATNQNSVQSMVDLLNTLRTEVLPPILSILQQLNDSGIAVTVVGAIGTMLQAIASFLESGAAQGLAVFVTVLAEFISLLADIASLPVIGDILGGIAAGVAALAAVSIVARFTGLFKLWDFFTWMTRNRGNLSGAFTDAARGVAGLQTTGQINTPDRPTSSIGAMGAETLNNQARATDNVARASQAASVQTNLFSRALQNVRGGSQAATTGVSGLASMIGAGGPLGVALVAATVAIGVLSNASANYNGKIDTLKLSLGQLGTEYDKLTASGESFGASTDDALQKIVENNPELQKAVLNLDAIGVSFEDLSRAASGSQTDMTATLQAIDSELDTLGDKWRDESNFLFTVFSEDAQKTSERMTQLRQLREAIVKNGEASKLAADANKVMAASTDEAAKAEGALANFIGPVSVETRKRLSREYEDNANKIKALEGYVKTFSSAESTATDKADALRNAIKAQTGSAETATEAAENYNRKMLDLKDSVEANGKSLNAHTRAGLSNRDALQAAAGAVRERYLQDIAAGVPTDKATQRHQDRIKALKEEARRLGLAKDETKKLIDTYGDVPENLKTDVDTDTKGFQKVYADLLKLQVMQNALKQGKSMAEAQRDWVNASSGLYERYNPNKNYGDGYGAPGFATGGPVWGAGTRNSDSIRAWLSNGEFVQPTDAVEHYGLPLMEAIRSRKLDKNIIQEALPDTNSMAYRDGGQVHSHNCPACESGGHKFAQGGSIRVPIVVDPGDTKVDKNWAYAMAGDLGGGNGGGGYRWQMRVLRQRFPGLDLWSGYRPGSRTLSGNLSYHARGRAVDLAPRRDVAQWIRANYGARTKELITPFNDLNLWNGRPHRYTGAVWNQHNFAGGNAHNHWAFKSGGLVDLMNMLNLNNLDSYKSAPLPTAPRTLSPAASSVVNNNSDNNTTFGDVIINNPVPERGGDSIRNALYRTMYLV